MEIEQHFGIDIPQGIDFRSFTVGDMHALLVEQAAANPGEAARLWKELVDVIEKSQGFEREAIRPEARFIRDLRIE